MSTQDTKVKATTSKVPETTTVEQFKVIQNAASKHTQCIETALSKQIKLLQNTAMKETEAFERARQETYKILKETSLSISEINKSIIQLKNNPKILTNGEEIKVSAVSTQKKCRLIGSAALKEIKLICKEIKAIRNGIPTERSFVEWGHGKPIQNMLIDAATQEISKLIEDLVPINAIEAEIMKDRWIRESHHGCVRNLKYYNEKYKPEDIYWVVGLSQWTGDRYAKYQQQHCYGPFSFDEAWIRLSYFQGSHFDIFVGKLERYRGEKGSIYLSRLV